MGWLKNIAKYIRYLPYAWMGIKALWAIYKARLKQDGLREALEKERLRRIKLERDRDLADRLDDPLSERIERIRRERKARREGD